MDAGYTLFDNAGRGRRDAMARPPGWRRCPMAARTGSRRWWTLAILPAMAVSACGGSRLTHDAIVTAVNGGPLSTGAAAQQQQQEPESAVSALPQNGVAQPLPGTAGAGGVSGGA